MLTSYLKVLPKSVNLFTKIYQASPLPNLANFFQNILPTSPSNISNLKILPNTPQFPIETFQMSYHMCQISTRNPMHLLLISPNYCFAIQLSYIHIILKSVKYLLKYQKSFPKSLRFLTDIFYLNLLPKSLA